MLDDAAVLHGRQTKWKYVTILILLAAMAAGMEWHLAHGEEFMYVGDELCLEGEWRVSGCSPETEAIALGEELYFADGATVTVLEVPQNAGYTLEAEQNVELVAGGGIFAYTPGAKQLYMLGPQGSKTLNMPGRCDSVAAGESSFAVITAGSGFLTRTDIFSMDGELTGRIGKKNSAMVRCAFFGENLAALCYDTNGQWHLEAYSCQGAPEWEILLETDICYDLVNVGRNLAVWTEDALLFFDKNGSSAGSQLLGSGEIVAWATGEKDYLALVICSRGAYTLKTFSGTGKLLGEAELPMEIRDLEVSGSNICLLDFESLRVYDAFCQLQSVSEDGARAVSIAADGKGLWMLGDGEMMYLDS